MSQTSQEVQSRYEQMLADGLSPKLAEMFALQKPPQSFTDVEFLKGRHEQFAKRPQDGDKVAKISAKHGLTSTKGLTYVPSIAAFPGDPEAWVSGKGDIQRVCEARGYTCEGDVTVKSTGQVKELTAVPLAASIVEQEVNSMLRADPSLRSKNKQELREQVIDKRTGPLSGKLGELTEPY